VSRLNGNIKKKKKVEINKKLKNFLKTESLAELLEQRPH
jgi:hypothetical protein